MLRSSYISCFFTQVKVTRGYYSAISYIDAQIGRILGSVENNGLLNNTVIVFMSDHGESYYAFTFTPLSMTILSVHLGIFLYSGTWLSYSMDPLLPGACWNERS